MGTAAEESSSSNEDSATPLQTRHQLMDELDQLEAVDISSRSAATRRRERLMSDMDHE